jgi:hypothetical protein
MARVLLRMPDVLLKQIDAARAEAAQAAGWPIDRTAFLLRLIAEGLDRVGRRRAPRTPGPAVEGEPPHAELGFDAAKYVLGKLCPRRHSWRQTGQSLLFKANHRCAECSKERARERRQERKGGRSVATTPG